MKTKKEEKLAKRLWWKQHSPLLGLLVFSIALAVTIVACKKEFNEPPEDADVVNYHPGGNYGVQSPESSIATDLFESVGKSLLSDAASDGTGWVLSAIGFSGSSGQEVEELGKINEQLVEINEKLNIMISELVKLDADVIDLGCISQTDEISKNISHVDYLYSQYYTVFLQFAMDSIATSEADLNDFVDLVTNGSSQEPGIGDILSNFKTTLWAGQNPIIEKCLNPSLIPLPTDGVWADTGYYNTIKNLTDYYYSYYVKALVLYTEANNYMAWDTANALGLIDSTFQSSNVNTICALDNIDIRFYCQQNIDEVNDTYTSLIEFLTFGGAPYTDSVQITLMSTEVMNEFIWPRSIELYNKGTGANCPDPYIWDGSDATNKCGPLMSHYAAGLGSNHFNNTTGWYASTLDDLQHLVNVDSAKSFSSIGAYLESKGFENMVGTQKIIQVRDPVKVALDGASSYIDVIPFMFVDWPVIKNDDKKYRAVFSGNHDFTFLCNPKVVNASVGGSTYGTTYTYEYFSQDDNMTYPLGIDSYVPKSWLWCRAGQDSYQFNWTNKDFELTDIQLPGWYKYRQDNAASGEYSYTTAYPFKLPVTRPSHITCTNSRSSTNKGGMPTKCGADLDAWLAALVPKPPVQ